jgi:hypothetical protein
MRDNEKPPGREPGGFGTIRRTDFREGFRFTVPPERASVAAVWLSLAIRRRLWPAAHVHETIDQCGTRTLAPIRGCSARCSGEEMIFRMTRLDYLMPSSFGIGGGEGLAAS